MSRRMRSGKALKFCIGSIWGEIGTLEESVAEIRKRKWRRGGEESTREAKKDLTQRAQRPEHGVRREERSEDGKAKKENEK